MRTRIAPGGRHPLDLLGGLLDDHWSARFRLDVLLQPQRRDHRADVVVDLGGLAGAVDRGASGPARRSTRPAARSSRGRRAAGSRSPRACRRRAGSAASRPGRRRRRAWAGRTRRGSCGPPSRTRAGPDSRRTTSSSGTSISSAAVTRRPSSESCSSSALACSIVRGKPSRMKPSWASSSLQPLGGHRDDQVVGHQVAGVHELLAPCGRARSPSLTLARSMSPVEMNGSWKSVRRRSACVPLPAPGGPNRIRLSSSHGVHCIDSVNRRGRLTGRLPRGQLPRPACQLATSGSPRSCASSAAPRAASSCPARRRSRSGSRCRRRRSWRSSG